MRRHALLFTRLALVLLLGGTAARAESLPGDDSPRGIGAGAPKAPAVPHEEGEDGEHEHAEPPSKDHTVLQCVATKCQQPAVKCMTACGRDDPRCGTRCSQKMQKCTEGCGMKPPNQSAPARRK